MTDEEKHDNMLDSLADLLLDSEIVNAIEDVDIDISVEQLLECETSQPQVRVTATKTGIKYIIRGHIRLRKRHAIGGTLLSIGMILGNIVYAHIDSIIQALSIFI